MLRCGRLRSFEKDLVHTVLDPENEVCSFCAGNVWNADLHRKLVDAARDRQRPGSCAWSYSRSASDFLISLLSGCSWCKGIVNALLTSKDWDSSTATGLESVNLDTLNCEVDLKVSIQFKHGDVSTAPILGNLHMTVIVLVKTTTAETLCDQPRTVADWEDGYQVEVFFDGFSITGANVPSASGSASVLGTMGHQFQRWLEYCKDNHTACREAQSPFMPTRLINVNAPIKLVYCEGRVEPAPYVVLSYVWGAARSHILTSETQYRRTLGEGMDEENLPQTIRDAIEVTRRLGYTYLWVDSLCIVQDSPEDKNSQIPRMGAYFRNADLTIVAARARSAVDGFLKLPELPEFKRPPAPLIVTLPAYDATPSNHLQIRCPHYLSYDSFSDPINFRAWTLQERVLSIRILIFSYNGPKWLCQESKIDPGAPELDESTWLDVISLSSRGDSAKENDYYRKLWLELRTQYANRKLSVAADKLPAIHGIAKAIADCTGWHYVAGVWEEFLFQDLHWHTEWQQPRPERPFHSPPPTWSWASVDGDFGSGLGSDDTRVPFHFRVVEFDASDMDKQWYHCTIKVECVTVELQWGESWEYMSLWHDLVDTREQPEAAVGRGKLDVADLDIQSGSKITCMPVSISRAHDGESHGHDRPVVQGLLLQPFTPSTYSQLSGPFYRIGWFHTPSPVIFNGAEKRTLALI
ncbi:heterokaryon incompatibility protein-domain-containing protein [Cadophora sp. MPI-SDFR-AT-0126]|nr:heterokaryon incompatibility protein-domain-containing protein [Leotiomycetes sp. MPI-SDFR-AT-0126]